MAIISLASKPNTAIKASELAVLGICALNEVNMINTTPIRPICSISWVIPGIRAFCLPRKYPFMQL